MSCPLVRPIWTKGATPGVTTQFLNILSSIYQALRKANSTLGLLRRILGECSAAVKSRAYTSLVRPQLEYASTAWNPYTKRNINKIEMVQRRAARFVFNDYSRASYVSPMIDHLSWDNPQQRRLLHQATMFYKIYQCLVGISLPDDVCPLTRASSLPNICPYRQIQSCVNEYFIKALKHLRFYADVEGFENPSVVTGLEDRPDMIIENYTNRAIYAIELTIRFDTNITKKSIRKTTRYREFCNALKQRYNTVEYFNLSMGAIDVIGIECKKIYGFLENVMSLDIFQINFLTRKLCGVCIRTTVYVLSDREWNNPELLYW
ncbi:Hypothetical predicted protein [Paramuricea clavata]|uniref:Uncharacterized protein n=1 Tax=Paramuricea clavata TaxID=317549 RepID=A0A7D9EFB4_PARCT|nr:Hypothetical predicted protein [Paramuricea clavata]